MTIVKKNDEDLENVSSGLVVSSPGDNKPSKLDGYLVVNEHFDGRLVCGTTNELGAQHMARQWGLSDEIISLEEYWKGFPRGDENVW